MLTDLLTVAVLALVGTRLVTTDRGSVFIYCPLLQRYPGQPVRACDLFVPRA